MVGDIVLLSFSAYAPFTEISEFIGPPKVLLFQLQDLLRSSSRSLFDVFSAFLTLYFCQIKSFLRGFSSFFEIVESILVDLPEILEWKALEHALGFVMGVTTDKA